MISYLTLFLSGLLGLPIFALMGGIALWSFYSKEIDLSAVAVEIYRLSSSPTLACIPIFTFAGYLLAESKSPQRLLKLSNYFFGNLPGGIAVMGIVLCAFFTAFTGASGVTIIALGGLLMPILMEKKYSEKFSLGLITTCGSLGLLFPPSLPIILYGIIAKVDIDKLFKAGMIPGLLLVLALSLYSYFKSPKTKMTAGETFKLKEVLWLNRFEIPLPFLVLGGIYGGFVTTSEASILTAVYVLIMECFLYRDLNFFKDVPRIAKESMTLVGSILIILCSAMGLTNYLVDEEVPMKILELMRQFISDRWMFLIALNIFLLIVGCLMDIFSAIIVVVPLILPLANEFHVDPLHLAIIFLTNLEIGYITPPVGINLFISSFRFNKPILEIYKSTLPFLFILLITLLIITFIPWLTLLWF
jgi:C4-dicarboxylate transporter DctM subunit